MEVQYREETLTQRLVVCPLINVSPCTITFEDDIYRYSNCSKCDCISTTYNDECPTLEHNGRKYHYRCSVEKNNLLRSFEREAERNEEKKRIYQALQESLDNCRDFDYEKFIQLCAAVDQNIMKSAASLNEQMVLRPFCSDDDIFIVYYLENGVPKKIHTSQNIASVFAKYYDQLRIDNNCQIGYWSVPASICDLIIVNLCIRHKIDVMGRLTIDNPIYVKDKNLNKYIDAAYGLPYWEFKKIKANHPELTEIVNGTSIIYIKQEIDEIIRRHDY